MHIVQHCAKSLFTSVSLLIIFTSGHVQAQKTAIPISDEAADRVAIRELIDAYAHDADRRETEKQTELFTDAGIIENIHTEPGKKPETTILQGRPALRTGFSTLKNFEVTMHFNGQSTIDLHGDTAMAETYCLAHHIFTENGQRVLMILGLRYTDTMVRISGHWLFSKRQLHYDWVDRRPLNP